jgi:hypothetical protein
MSEQLLVRWSGSLTDEEGWGRDLCEYLSHVHPQDVSLGRMPPSVREELDSGTAPTAVERTATALATVLIACQQVYGSRTAGVVSQSAAAELYAAYSIDASMTNADQPVDDRGNALTVSMTPSRNEPFMLADVLKRYVDQGFPERIENQHGLTRGASVRFDEYVAVVRELDMVGSYAKSPNARFALVWSDQANGRWALLDGEKVLSQGRRTGRISNGAVSDVGRCLVATTLSLDPLRSEFVGIEWTGDVFFTSRFDALPVEVGISRSGRLGAVHLAASGQSGDARDGNALILFDLTGNQELWRRRLAVYPRHLLIREDIGLIDCVLADEVSCSFHLDGRTALDDPGYVDHLKTNARSDVLAALGWARLEDVGAPDRDEPALAVLETAVAKSEDPYFKARTLRDLGNVTEAQLPEKTVTYWREALQLSPQIGVKKKLAELEHRLNLGSVEILKPTGKTDGDLEILACYEKVRADQVICLGASVIVASSSKGRSVVSVVNSDGSLMELCQLPGAGPRLVPMADTLLVLTDEGKIGDGRGWASLVNTDGGLVAQKQFADKLTEASECGTIVAVGCRDGHLYGLGASDLSDVWRFQVPGGGDGYSPPHPYHVTAAGGVVWISYMGTFWCLDCGRGQQHREVQLDMPTELVALPDGTLATSVFRGVVLVSLAGSVKLTEISEWNPKLYGADAARGHIIAGRWGQGESWHVLDFGGNIVTEAKLGPCTQAELGPKGHIAYWNTDTVTVTDSDFKRIGSLKQPELTGNRVRAAAFEHDGAGLWVIGKGLWRVAVGVEASA